MRWLSEGLTVVNRKEIVMFHCLVCGSGEAHEETVSEVFFIDEKPVLVENIPAQGCSHGGEATFDRETTEEIRRMLHEKKVPVKSVKMDVYAFK
jgi:HTH-type transcriptional regulator / antitoxin MqsA